METTGATDHEACCQVTPPPPLSLLTEWLIITSARRQIFFSLIFLQRLLRDIRCRLGFCRFACSNVSTLCVSQEHRCRIKPRILEAIQASTSVQGVTASSLAHRAPTTKVQLQRFSGVIYSFVIFIRVYYLYYLYQFNSSRKYFLSIQLEGISQTIGRAF